MAVSLTDKDPEHATAGSSEVPMQSDSPKGNEAEMKDSELDMQAAITLDPNSSESANKGGGNEATPESSLSTPQPISTDESAPSLTPPSSPSHSPHPPQTPASTTAPTTNAKVAKAFDQPRLPSAFKSQRRPEPKVAKSKRIYIDFKRPVPTPRRATLRVPNPASTSTPPPPTPALPAAPAGTHTLTPIPAPGSALVPTSASVHTPAIASVNPAAPVLPSGPQDLVAPMAIDIPHPITSTSTVVTPNNSSLISLPAASTVVSPTISEDIFPDVTVDSAANEALKAFNLIQSTADTSAAPNSIIFTPANSVSSTIPPFPPLSIPSPPFPPPSVAGAQASEPLNISSSASDIHTFPSNVNGSASLSPASLTPPDSLMTGIPSPAPLASPSPSPSQNHTNPNGTPSTNGKGKARAEDENRVDWRAAVESSGEGSVSDVDTGAVQAAMSMSKNVYEVAQRQQVSSVYHSQSGEAYELFASGSSSLADDSDEALDAELAALLHEPNPSSSKKVRRPSKSRLSAARKAKRKKLPPILEQVEEDDQGATRRGAGLLVPEIKVTPPEAESMVEVDPVNVPATVQTPEAIDAGSSIRGADKPLGPSVSEEMEDVGASSQPAPAQPTVPSHGIAVPQLSALVPTLPPTAEEQEEAQLANFSPPSTGATFHTSPLPSSFATSAASFGLRTSPKRSPPPGLTNRREPAKSDHMDEDDDAGEFLARLFTNGPTSDRQFDAGSPSDDANLPPLPSFFGVRTFSSTMTPETEVNSSLPPTAEDDKMDEDAVPLLDRVAPSTTGTSLLSRIGPRKGGLFSAPLSLANAPPLEGASEPTPSLTNAPPLGSTSAFPSAFSSSGSAPALGLYTPQQDASSGASTTATAPTHWPKWGDWGAAWGGSAQTSASAPPAQAQHPILSTAPILTQAPATTSPPPSLSPLELANAFWTSASVNVGTDSPAREEPNFAAPDDSSSPESDYDSDDSSASSFWDSASDGEDDFGRNVKANGILTPPRSTSSRNDRFGVPSRQSSMETARVVPHIVLTLTLLRMKRDRSESEEFSDSSGDEGVPVCAKRQRRRYRAPGDTFIREQFRGVGSSPLSSPLLLPLKALPLPPAKKQVFNLDDIDTTIDLFY